jgi:polyferredoxin
MPYQRLADAVLLLHFGVVLFVVGGLVAIVVGNRLHWRWVDGWAFRCAHLGAIGFVVVQAWWGQTCPLTVLESWLRVRAGSAAYDTSFIEHWVQRLLYHQAPAWVFVLAYSAFAALVLLAWWRYPPRRRRGRAVRGGPAPRARPQ